MHTSALHLFRVARACASGVFAQLALSGLLATAPIDSATVVNGPVQVFRQSADIADARCPEASTGSPCLDPALHAIYRCTTVVASTAGAAGAGRRHTASAVPVVTALPVAGALRVRLRCRRARAQWSW
jgi:hypothetical protein